MSEIRKIFNRVRLAAAVAGTALFASCSKSVSEPAFVLPLDREAPIFFCADIENGLITKGAAPVTDLSLRTSHLGLYAYWEQQNEYYSGGSADQLYLDNQEVVYSDTEGGVDYWVCSPTAYWPLGCNLTFFAYAPYIGEQAGILDFPLREAGMPKGHFTQLTDVDKQLDLCLSTPLYDVPKGTSRVDLSFRHALTKVLFYFNLNDNYSEDTRAFMVKSLTISNVVGENTFTFGGATGFTWNNLPRADMSSRTASYSLSLEDGTLSYVALPSDESRQGESGLARYECVNGEDAGILYLLPQPMTGGSFVTVVVSAYEWDAVNSRWNEMPDSEMDPVDIYLPETTVWDKGRTVAYSAHLDAGIPIVFSVSILDWDATTVEDVEFEHN